MPITRQIVSQAKLRALFNEHIGANLEHGTYHREARSSRPASLSSEPPGTLSVMFNILDENYQRVALVHCYLRPDGTIGATGKYDPKQLLLNGILYHL